MTKISKVYEEANETLRKQEERLHTSSRLNTYHRRSLLGKKRESSKRLLGLKSRDSRSKGHNPQSSTGNETLSAFEILQHELDKNFRRNHVLPKLHSAEVMTSRIEDASLDAKFITAFDIKHSLVVF